MNYTEKFTVDKKLHPYVSVSGYYDKERFWTRRIADGLFAPTREAKDPTSTPTYIEGARKYGLSAPEHCALPIFAREFLSTNTGTIGCVQRTFITGSYTRFHRMYTETMSAQCRSFHEVIDSDEPCNLYYDLDLAYKDAVVPKKIDGLPGFIPEVALATFNELVASCMAELMPVDPSKLVFVNCEACTENKFSVHGVVRGAAPAFASSDHARHFMEFVKRRATGNSKYKMLWWTPLYDNSKNRTDRFLADMAVYTRNHSMRMFGSSKPYHGTGGGRYLCPVATHCDDANSGKREFDFFITSERESMKTSGRMEISFNEFSKHMIQNVLIATPIVTLTLPGQALDDNKAVSRMPTAWHPKHPQLFEELLKYMERVVAEKVAGPLERAFAVNPVRHTSSSTSSSSTSSSSSSSSSKSTSSKLTPVHKEGPPVVVFSRSRLHALPGQDLRVRVDTTTTYCPLANERHAGNHQYAIICFASQMFIMMCYRERCAGMTVGHRFDDSMLPLVTAIRNGTPLPSIPPPLSLAKPTPTKSVITTTASCADNDDVEDYDADFPAYTPKKSDSTAPVKTSSATSTAGRLKDEKKVDVAEKVKLEPKKDKKLKPQKDDKKRKARKDKKRKRSHQELVLLSSSESDEDCITEIDNDDCGECITDTDSDVDYDPGTDPRIYNS
jgi:hypothetical protein